MATSLAHLKYFAWHFFQVFVLNSRSLAFRGHCNRNSGVPQLTACILQHLSPRVSSRRDYFILNHIINGTISILIWLHHSYSYTQHDFSCHPDVYYCEQVINIEHVQTKPIQYFYINISYKNISFSSILFAFQYFHLEIPNMIPPGTSLYTWSFKRCVFCSGSEGVVSFFCGFFICFW